MDKKGKETERIEAYETAHVIPGNQVTHEYIETARVVISERMIIEKEKSMEYFIVKDEINGHTGDISPSKVNQLLGDKVVRTVLISQSKSLANFKLEEEKVMDKEKLAAKEFLVKELGQLSQEQPEDSDWDVILHAVENDEPLEDDHKVKLGVHLLKEINETFTGIKEFRGVDLEKEKKRMFKIITVYKNALYFYTN
jgi:hypothetical protein